MVVTVIGADLNLVGLVVVTLDKDESISKIYMWILLTIFVGLFLFLPAAMEILARVVLKPIQRDFSAIQARRAPSFQAYDLNRWVLLDSRRSESMRNMLSAFLESWHGSRDIDLARG